MGLQSSVTVWNSCAVLYTPNSDSDYYLIQIPVNDLKFASMYMSIKTTIG